MSFWVLFQVLIDVILLASVVAIWFKLNRPAKDDPRLSRGLQLLQSKISVLEDLGDRTEAQVQQLNQLLEQKAREVQSQIQHADRQLKNIDNSMNRSLEVAKIFQDKIPHQEIIERQNTVKYVKAARMAHQGASVQDISREVDLSLGEIEFIAKVNRNQLQFSEEDLPEWVSNTEIQPTSTSPHHLQFSNTELQRETEPQATPQLQHQVASPVHARDLQDLALSELGQQFRQALVTPPEPAVVMAPPQKPAATAPARPVAPQGPNRHTGEVRKVIFPRVNVNGNLG